MRFRRLNGGTQWSSVPASPTASGTAGQIAYDGSHFYVCTATNTWGRASLKSWADPYYDNVSLLVHADGDGSLFSDFSARPKIVTAYGGATQSSAQSKWGGKSAYFDGTGDYLRVSDSSSFALGSQDFVIEFWMYASQQMFAPIVHQVSLSAGVGWSLWNYDVSDIGLSTRKIGFSIRNGVDLYSPGDAYTDNTWTHIAVSRSGSALNLYSNGTRLATTTFTGSIGKASNSLGIGWLSADDWTSGVSSFHYNGYIDDLRITVGTARGYTGATITVPTAAFPDT